MEAGGVVAPGLVVYSDHPCPGPHMGRVMHTLRSALALAVLLPAGLSGQMLQPEHTATLEWRLLGPSIPFERAAHERRVVGADADLAGPAAVGGARALVGRGGHAR